MAATVVLNEYNGAGETKTANVTNVNMGNTDAPNLDPNAYPIEPGNNSYEKWNKLEVTALGGVSTVKNFKVYRSGALGGAATHLTSCKTSAYSAPTYAQPVATDSTVAVNAMPTSEPASANLGIGGSLTGELTAAGETDYLVHQIQTDPTDTAGSTSTLTVAWDEIA